jgi:hypothetical protein
VDNGKTTAKSSKAASRSGICQWPDTILEPIWFSKDEVSKEFVERRYKIVVSVVWVFTSLATFWHWVLFQSPPSVLRDLVCPVRVSENVIVSSNNLDVAGINKNWHPWGNFPKSGQFFEFGGSNCYLYATEEMQRWNSFTGKLNFLYLFLF